MALVSRPGMAATPPIEEALAAGRIGGRVWFYSNYHCNLQCSYCVTESAPLVKRRELGTEAIIERLRGDGRRSHRARRAAPDAGDS